MRIDALVLAAWAAGPPVVLTRPRLPQRIIETGQSAAPCLIVTDLSQKAAGPGSYEWNEPAGRPGGGPASVRQA